MNAGDPAAWTLDGFVRHMVHVQGLRRRSESGRESTALHRARYVRQLMTDGVQLHPPREESWLDWLDQRMDEGRPRASLENQRKAMLSLLAYLGMPPWPSLLNAVRERPPPRAVPPQEVVRELCTRRDLLPDPYLADLMPHLFRWCFGTGIRVPSEVVVMDLDDVDWDAGTIRVREPKKARTRIVGPVDPGVMAHLAEYVRELRGTAPGPLWRTSTHRRWSATYLSTLMRRAGQQVWPEYYPYCSRAWFVTTALAQGAALEEVADAIGDTVRVTWESYARHHVVRAARGWVWGRNPLAPEGEGKKGDQGASPA